MHLLILKHIKLEDINMWFCGSGHLSHIFLYVFNVFYLFIFLKYNMIHIYI